MKLTMRRMKGYDVEAQLALIDELESIHVSGLIISPINDTRIAEAINALVDKAFSSSTSIMTYKTAAASVMSAVTTPMAVKRPAPCCSSCEARLLKSAS